MILILTVVDEKWRVGNPKFNLNQKLHTWMSPESLSMVHAVCWLNKSSTTSVRCIVALPVRIGKRLSLSHSLCLRMVVLNL